MTSRVHQPPPLWREGDEIRVISYHGIKIITPTFILPLFWHLTALNSSTGSATRKSPQRQPPRGGGPVSCLSTRGTRSLLKTPSHAFSPGGLHLRCHNKGLPDWRLVVHVVVCGVACNGHIKHWHRSASEEHFVADVHSP